LSNVWRDELERSRTGPLAAAINAIMSAGWSERAMQKPPVLEWMAWRRYLNATRASSLAAYGINEEEAWRRLQDDLAQVATLPPPDRSPFASSTTRLRRAPSSSS
jgi:hypothetical protein